MKNKNIHILPTDKPSRLVTINENLYFDKKEREMMSAEFLNIEAKNIYITSDEEIKEGDWIYGLFNGGVILKSDSNIKKNSQYYKEYGLKIILTTDGDLINDGVQAPDDEFLEWFVKNPSCEEIEIKKEYITPLGDIVETCYDNERLNYKIIIPKEESKQSTKNRIFSETSKEIKQKAKDYGNSLVNKEKQKQHLIDLNPLQQATELFFRKKDAKNCTLYKAAKFGAKWKQDQDKNKYSEEEVGELIYNIIGEYGKYYGIMIDGNKLNNLFEQYKKK